MDERVLFAQFHEALDIEPRPGASARLRIAITDNPVALKRRPVLRMRWSKMGLRVAAVLAAAVIAAAVGAAILATHRAPTGSVPARPDPNVSAYEAMIGTDHYNFVASTSNHCGTIQDTGCASALKPVLVTLEKWVSDLNAFQTPAQFAVLDGQLRRHLNALISEAKVLVVFQKAKNQPAFDAVQSEATLQQEWIDEASFAVAAPNPNHRGSFHDALTMTKTFVDDCTNAPADTTCATDPLLASHELEAVLVDLLFVPAPTALTLEDARLQADLAAADTALLAVTDSQLNGRGKAATDVARNSFVAAIAAARSDLSAIGGA